MRRAVTAIVCLLMMCATGVLAERAFRLQDPVIDEPVFVVYFWRAKPDRLNDYNAYIQEIAEPIDEDARRAGVFEEVHTYLATPVGDAAPEWTHVRMFRVKNAAAADRLGAGLDEATRRLYPEQAQRDANSSRAAGLRDFVRQERWRALRR